MIHEVDEVLKGLLGGGALAGSGIEIVLRGPDPRLGGPAQRARRQRLPVRHPRGREPARARARSRSATSGDVVVRRRQPPRWFRLSYLVTAWTKRPRTNTGCCPPCWPHCSRASSCPPTNSPARSAQLGLSVPLTVAGLHTEARSMAEIWSRAGRRTQAVPGPRGHRALPGLPRVRRRAARSRRARRCVCAASTAPWRARPSGDTGRIIWRPRQPPAPGRMRPQKNTARCRRVRREKRTAGAGKQVT